MRYQQRYEISLRDMLLFAIKPLFVKKDLIIFQKFLLLEKGIVNVFQMRCFINDFSPIYIHL